jgi:integrase
MRLSRDGYNNSSIRYRVYRETRNAFDKIGINNEERINRGIALHHWRHFLNTALLMANVSTLKVQKVTGHKSLSMTRHYTHFDSRDFTEVLDVQNNLIGYNDSIKIEKKPLLQDYNPEINNEKHVFSSYI